MANRTESLPNSSGETFKVGDGVHWGWNGDRDPGTVVKVSDSGRQVWVSDDMVQVHDKGYIEGDRNCTFTTIVNTPEEHLACWKLRKNGSFTRYSLKDSKALHLGRRYARNPHI